ncbi:MAG: hypothetical protein KDB80_01175 [Planctomycetes bacterium]|nr:hypothetical protein [Planctomycetota bacterium]
MFTARSLALAVTTLAGTLAAQPDGARIVGLTAGTPFVQSQDLVNCNARRCAPPGVFGQPVFDHRGGTAYDTRTRGTWISDGTRIAKVDSRLQCVYQCGPVPMPSDQIASDVTGLAYHHRTNRLWVTDSANRVRIYDISGCTLTLQSQCSVLLPLGHVLTGIALDDVGSRVILTSAEFSGLSAGGWVHIASQNAPCDFQCTAQIQACITSSSILGPLTGCAYDACESEIWVTDGRVSVSCVLSALNCTLIQTGCCTNPLLNDPYVGLCIEPSTEYSTGGVCSAGGCDNSCQPHHFLGNGDPVIGNIGFTLDAASLPANQVAATFFNGGIADPVGYLVPGFCEEIHVPLTPTLLSFPANTGGGVGCSGSTSLNFSIQANPSTCGLTITTQVMGICFNPIIGTFVTNALTWTVTSS